MNSIKGFMNGLYKVVGPAVNVLFALFLTIAGNCGFQALKASKNAITLSNIFTIAASIDGKGAAPKEEGTGFITFLQVLFWIIAVIYIGCKVLELLNALNENPGALKSLKPAGIPAQNAQPQQFNQPAQAIPQPTAAPAANAGAERFCTQCGAKVPAGNAFCTSCGAKMD